MARPRPRLENHRKLKIARQYARSYAKSHPDENKEEIAAAVKAELQSEFPDEFGEGFDWTTFLPLLIEFITALLSFFSDED